MGASNLKLYKTILRPVVNNPYETWTRERKHGAKMKEKNIMDGKWSVEKREM